MTQTSTKHKKSSSKMKNMLTWSLPDMPYDAIRKTQSMPQHADCTES